MIVLLIVPQDGAVGRSDRISVGIPTVFALLFKCSAAHAERLLNNTFFGACQAHQVSEKRSYVGTCFLA